MTPMRAVTIKEAKATLNELVELALAGEEIVLMRGSRHVVALIPLTDADLELAPRLSDEQAARLWRELAGSKTHRADFGSSQEAADHMRHPSRKRPR